MIGVAIFLAFIAVCSVVAKGIQSDEQGGNYVYVAEGREGIPGAEWGVRKVAVTLDQTDLAAGVESAEITTDTRIIVNTTKELKDGDVVRLISWDSYVMYQKRWFA